MNMAESHLSQIERPASPAGHEPAAGEPSLATRFTERCAAWT